MSSDLIAQARAHLEAARLDPVELERLRRQTLLGILIAKGVPVPNADALDSVALQELLDRYATRAA